MRTVSLVAVLLLTAAAVPASGAAAQETVTVTVTVENDDGQAIGGATVNATWDGGHRTVTTASNGKAFVDVPQGARVELDAHSEEYVRNFPVVVESAQGGEEVTVEVARKGYATVTVDDANGALANARVIVRQSGRPVASGRTDEAGAYESPALERGTYTLVTFKPGYYANRTTLTINANVTEAVEMRQGSVTVTFKVVDDHFEQPKRLENATVTVGDVGTVRTTGGRATVSVPVNSRIGVAVTKPEYRTAEETILVQESDKTVTVAVRKERQLDVRTANAKVVVGQTVLVSVVDAYGAPAANATVRIDGEAVGETGGEGDIRVPIESAGDHEIVAERDGVTSEAVIVEGIPAGGTTPSPTESATATPSATSDTSVALPGFTLLTGVAGVLAAAAVALLGRR